MVAAGLEEGLLWATQDVLRGSTGGTRAPRAMASAPRRRGGSSMADIPTASAVHALAAAVGERVWWRELQVLAVSYSGLRWGEMAALTADRVDPTRRRILLDRQVVEGRHGLVTGAAQEPPPATTMHPAPHAQGERSWGRCWPAAWGSWPPTGSCSPRPEGPGPGAPTTGATPSTPRPTPPAGPDGPTAGG
jgi:hypothetical protein